MGMANILWMDFDVIVHEPGTLSQVSYFGPYHDFPFQEEDKKNLNVRNYSKIIVLNFKNNHFNLVVDKSSMMAQLGSFVFQRKTAKTAAHKSEMHQTKQNKVQELNITLKNLDWTSFYKPLLWQM